MMGLSRDHRRSVSLSVSDHQFRHHSHVERPVGFRRPLYGLVVVDEGGTLTRALGLGSPHTPGCSLNRSEGDQGPALTAAGHRQGRPGVCPHSSRSQIRKTRGPPLQQQVTDKGDHGPALTTAGHRQGKPGPALTAAGHRQAQLHLLNISLKASFHYRY